MSEGKSLEGKVIWVTRSSQRAQGITHALEHHGAKVLVVATTYTKSASVVERKELRDALAEAKIGQWILFTSVTSVEVCCQFFTQGAQAFEGQRIAVVGEASQRCLERYGGKAALVSKHNGSKGLARLLLEQDGVRTSPVLFPRAKKGRQEAMNILEEAGIKVVLFPAYETKAIRPDDPQLSAALNKLKTGKLDAVAFFAPSQVNGLLQEAPEIIPLLAKLPLIAAIGQTTAKALQDRGLVVGVVADIAKSDHFANKIASAFSSKLFLDPQET